MGGQANPGPSYFKRQEQILDKYAKYSVAQVRKSSKDASGTNNTKSNSSMPKTTKQSKAHQLPPPSKAIGEKQNPDRHTQNDFARDRLNTEKD